MPPFVVFALPRSRTYWLSKFLTYGEWHCGHEELIHCRSLDDVSSWLSQPCTGTVETAAAPFWRLLPAGVRIVTVRRDPAEVVDSFARTGITFDPDVMHRLMRRYDAKLNQIEARLPGVLSVAFRDLETEDACARIFEHCLPCRHDPAWWRHVAPLNLQINLPHLVRYCEAHAKQLAKLAKVAKHRCLAAMRPKQRDLDGMTFQVEPFREFYRDAEPLFREHLVQTEQSPTDYTLKNVPLLERLDDLGFLQCLTARCNGRMFGYLMSILGPSLDSQHQIEALHTIFFASPDAPGLGMRLQRAAIEALRERGVTDLYLRAGHRGSGPRLGTLYRRLGAAEFGQLYRLELQ